MLQLLGLINLKKINHNLSSILTTTYLTFPLIYSTVDLRLVTIGSWFSVHQP